MDGSFACPECGSEVEVAAGLAPGRQVRCGFCRRLVEVPYLPRAGGLSWKRQRFGGLKWMRWAWMAVALIAAVATISGTIQFVKRQYRSVQEGLVQKLLATSRAKEAAGQLDQALIDLDTAIELARKTHHPDQDELERNESRRADLARRDAQATLDRLLAKGTTSFPLGDWLSLIARAGRDPDLKRLKSSYEERFRAEVRKLASTELATARQSFDSGRVANSLQACERIAKLLPHLPAGEGATIGAEAERLVSGLVRTHGVAFEPPRGEFSLGSPEAYRAALRPILVKALESKGYLPYRDSSPWKGTWKNAAYWMHVEVIERLEGNYLSSENRLSRIAAHLILKSQEAQVWQTKPSARTAEPLPGLPAYLSGHAAASREHSDEFERLLYENARGQITERISQALGNIPACPPGSPLSRP